MMDKDERITLEDKSAAKVTLSKKKKKKKQIIIPSNEVVGFEGSHSRDSIQAENILASINEEMKEDFQDLRTLDERLKYVQTLLEDINAKTGLDEKIMSLSTRYEPQEQLAYAVHSVHHKKTEEDAYLLEQAAEDTIRALDLNTTQAAPKDPREVIIMEGAADAGSIDGKQFQKLNQILKGYFTGEYLELDNMEAPLEYVYSILKGISTKQKETDERAQLNIADGPEDEEDAYETVHPQMGVQSKL